MDIDKLRNETPGVRHRIHFNNAGASLMPLPVIDRVIEYFKEESRFGGYETAAKYEDEIQGIYKSIAGFINCDPSEIALLQNATEAWDKAFTSISFKKGDKILTSEAEYASNYIPFLQIKKKQGVEIKVIPSNECGEIDLESLGNQIDDKVKLISLVHMPTNGGLINPAEEVGKIANRNGVLYLLDACQSVGHYPVDVKKIGCDFLSATGRKYLRGPRGTGFLFVKKSLLKSIEPFILDMLGATWIDKDNYRVREDARRFETWESNYANKLGLKEAVDYAQSLGIQNIWDRITSLSANFRGRLSELTGVNVMDLGSERSGIVCFTVKDRSPEEIKNKLFQNKINVTVTDMNSTLLDMKKRNLDFLVRASLHYYNTEEEISEFIITLRGLIT